MNYVLMIHAAESRFATLAPDQVEAVMQAYGKYTKDLFATGRAGDCAALEATNTATHVQVRDGKRIVKDGPFAETREQLGGYYAFAAKDEAEAIEWAAKIPDAEGGTIEVRPVPEYGGAPKEGMGSRATPPEAKGRKEYLLLIYEAEARWAKLSEAEMGKIFAAYGAFSASLKAAGQFIAGDQLDTVRKAKSVGLTGGKRVVKDGPFAETREQLGGYYRVFAKDLDEAISMAVRIPAAETGTIEIRPVMDTSAYD
ncbi:MAG: YciI family protein [Polyangiaceae bacterium]